jgi:hypothetical protein
VGDLNTMYGFKIFKLYKINSKNDISNLNR